MDRIKGGTMKVFLLAMLICFNAYAADEWDKSDPAGSESPSDLDSLITTNNEVIDRLLKNYQEGCKISYASASTLTVATGEVVCSNSTGALRKMRSNTSAVTVAWSMIDTDLEDSSKTYYVFAVADADATTFTVEISLSSSAPTGATYYARLGSFYNNADGDIEQIVNDNAITNVSVSTGTIAATETIPLPSGYTADQCEWIVGLGDLTAGSDSYGYSSITFTVNASRVVTVSMTSSGGGGSSAAGNANYMIIGVK